MQSAIQTTDIKQASYANYRDPDSKQETGYNGEVYNTISRHVFLPSVSEIGKAVDLKNPDKVKAFIKNISNNNSVFDDSIWTRDICLGYIGDVEYLDDYFGQLGRHPAYKSFGTRPAFVIDLSKVDYTEGEHVDYK